MVVETVIGIVRVFQTNNNCVYTSKHLCRSYHVNFELGI